MGIDSEDFQVQILPDESISPAHFKACPDKTNTYFAHPLTIEAMKKDIFLMGEGDIDLVKDPYTCVKCMRSMDKQFWTKCPFCGAKFTDWLL